MRYQILGQVEVTDGTRTVPLAQGRRRLLLAVLLVHANEPLASDRLVDLLWGESPPPTAARSLHNHISSLRKTLGDGHLVRNGRGYQLLVADDALDAARFDALSAQGRAAYAAGEPGRAAELLHEALGLWHGPAFGDLSYEAALQSEAAALEERRLATVEDRVDADLALGRHTELVAELDGLIAEHPVRERLRAQQMLALYRSGRQADALAVYADARRYLVSELGIEPGPALRELERAVLEQDPELGPARSPPPAPVFSTPRLDGALRHPWRLAGAGALLLAVAVAAVLIAGRSDPDPSGVAAAGGGDLLVGIDLATGEVTDQVTVGGDPTSVTVGGGAVWTLNSADRTITRVDPRTGKAVSFSSELPPVELAAGDDGLWVAQATPLKQGERIIDSYAVPSEVTLVDPLTGVARSTTTLPVPEHATSAPDLGGLIATDAGATWTISRPGRVNRLDTRTGELRTLRARNADAIAAADGQVWAYEHGAAIRLDPRSGRVLTRVPLAAAWVDALAIGEGAVWATDRFGGALWRIDPESGTAKTADVARGVDAVAVGGGAVWAASSELGTVSRIDPKTRRVTTTVKLPGTPRGLAVGDGRVWVSLAGTHRAAPAAGGLAADARVNALSGPPCSPVLADRRGDPDLLIASDLPLQAQRATTLPMSDAVEFVLRRHKFRAGRFTLGLQACDNASPESGQPDQITCRRNARLYAHDPAVIGIVGPWDSGCAWEMLPILNTAPGGPPSLVAPANSSPDLVRAPPDAGDDPLGELYPTGQRGYAQLYPADDYDVAAGILVAKRRGNGRVYYLEETGFHRYVPWMFDQFRAIARRAGVTVAGHGVYSQDAEQYRRLARRIRDSGAGAVYTPSGIEQNLRRVLRDLRATLGPDVVFIGTHHLTPVSLLVDTVGAPARGVLITRQGLQPQSLGPTGQRFIREFGAAQPGHQVNNLDVYAAAATEVLLDAIARSDGTREGVARALKRTRMADSVLGPLALQPDGEPVANPVTYARVEHGGSREDILLSIEGARIMGVIKPPARLIGADEPVVDEGQVP